MIEDLNLQSEEPIWLTPPWFYQARVVPYEESEVMVDGCGIHCLQWGDRSRPTLLLVHGNGAHAHWFHSTGGLLAEKYHVVAMTFSGMGDSGFRPKYERSTMVRDIEGVIEGLDLSSTILVGHSFGGMVSIAAAAQLQNKLSGLVVVDHAVQPADNTREWFEDNPPPRPHIIRETREELLKRFRLLPDQPCPNQWLLRYIAERSIKQVEGGWIWKFDPAIYQHMRLGTDHEGNVRNYALPMGFIYGGNTEEFSSGELKFTLSILPDHCVVSELPQSGHHVMLDQPQGFAQLLDRVIIEMLNSA